MTDGDNTRPWLERTVPMRNSTWLMVGGLLIEADDWLPNALRGFGALLAIMMLLYISCSALARLWRELRGRG